MDLIKTVSITRFKIEIFIFVCKQTAKTKLNNLRQILCKKSISEPWHGAVYVFRCVDTENRIDL